MHGRHSITPMSVTGKKKKNLSFMTTVLLCFGSIVFAFYLGIYIGWNMEQNSASSSSSSLVLGGGEGTVGMSGCDCSSNNSRVNNKATPTNVNEIIDWEAIATKQQQYIDKLMMAQRNNKEEERRQQQMKQQQQVQVPRALDRLDILQQTQTQNQQQQQKQPLQQPQQQQQQRPMFRQRNDNNDNQRTRYFLPRGEYVNRTDFHNKFSKQLGIPLDKNDIDNDRVLLLYSESKAFPKSNSNSENSNIDDENGNRMIPLKDAIENCDFMHVVLTNPDRHKQCIAIMGQYESYHVHRFMRMPMTMPMPSSSSSSASTSTSTTGIGSSTDLNNKPQPINSSHPLRYVPRGMQQNGRLTHKVPSDKYQTMYWNDLMNYKSSLVLSSKEDSSTDNNLSVMEELDPILRKVAAADGSNESNKHNNNNTVIILVCNFGQSELLMNFICNANSKGLSNLLDKIILFATDSETHELATSMGLHSYYSERIFWNMPTEAAQEYADDTFRLMMFAKVYCVHIVSQLGYDFLFQDVDVIWYKNPLDWFHNETNPDYHFDMFFQDDGSRALFYAPYAANTGFYYVRNNERTKYFFHSLLMSGDVIMATYSHQIALNALLSEHVSIYGLSVKICDRNDIEFPGGYWYHERHDLMKQYILLSSSSSSLSSSSSSSIHKDIPSTANISSKVSVSLQEPHPYVFHFSWTDNKDNKVRFMEQMGEWYLEETCKSVSRNNIINNTAAAAAVHGIMNSSNGAGNSASSLRQHCCAVTPLMKCHYRDKPSKIPCHDSISIDKDGKSFWGR